MGMGVCQVHPGRGISDIGQLFSSLTESLCLGSHHDDDDDDDGGDNDDDDDNVKQCLKY